MKGIHRLSARQVETTRHDGKHSYARYLPDGGSLYLRIRPNQGRSWVYKYRHKGSRKLHEVGLGSFPAVSLAEARRRADQAREEHKTGVDPIDKRREADAVARGIPTFGAAVAEYIEWRVRQTGKGKLEGSSLVEWRTTLRLHAADLNEMRVDQIRPEDIEAALKAVWAKNKSAPRILNRVEQVFARQIALRFRSDNPAVWDIQQHLLGHGAESGEGHKALPWQEVPVFMKRLRAETGPAARTLEFIILTASRAGQVIGNRDNAPMPWSEVDVERRLWTISDERMKGDKLHIVPLSDRALELLGQPGDGKVLKGSLSALGALVKKLGAKSTVHGFRSSFKSWSEENGWGNDPRLAEFALAHSLPDKVEASYNRVTRVEERRRLMQRWADYCAGIATDAKVVSLRKA